MECQLVCPPVQRANYLSLLRAIYSSVGCIFKDGSYTASLGVFFSLVFCHSLVKLKEKTEQSLKLGVVLQICLTTKEKGRITCLCLLAAVQLLQPGMWLISGAQLLTLVQLVLFCKQKSFCKSNFFFAHWNGPFWAVR